MKNGLSGCCFKSVQIEESINGTVFTFISPNLFPPYFQKIPIILLIKQKGRDKKKKVLVKVELMSIECLDYTKKIIIITKIDGTKYLRKNRSFSGSTST